MKISKNMKKLMSSIMVMALAFSSAFIAQPVKADTTPTPTVEVVGATLRLNNQSDVQAMRFAIKVTNADKAKDCGITIRTKNGREKVISVENNYKKIYDKDGNTITYTAVVTGIPASYAAEDFVFSGSVTPMVGDKTTTDTVSRNLTQVANAAGLAIDTKNGEIEATDMGGKKISSEWNDGKVCSLDKATYSGKTVNISFKLRMQGKVADGTQNVNLQINASSSSYPTVTKVPIKNEWVSVNVNNYEIPELESDYPELYINGDYVNQVKIDTTGMEFYIEDFTIGVIDTPAISNVTLKSDQVLKYVPKAENDTAYDTTTKTWKFADCTGYTSDFDITNYSKLVVKFKCYSDRTSQNDSTLIKENATFGDDYTKICLNSTSLDTYNWGNGDGFITYYVNNCGKYSGYELDSSTGICTVTYNLKSEKVTDTPDCITVALKGNGGTIGAVEIESMVFEA